MLIKMLQLLRLFLNLSKHQILRLTVTETITITLCYCIANTPEEFVNYVNEFENLKNLNIMKLEQDIYVKRRNILGA